MLEKLLNLVYLKNYDAERIQKMFKLDKGVLSMDNHDLDHIQGRIDKDGDSPKEALKKELEICGLDIKKVFSIELNMGQLKEKRYIDIYSKIVCDFWNK